MHTRILYIIRVIFCCIMLLPFISMPGSKYVWRPLILGYHSINDEAWAEEQLFVRPEDFYDQMKYLYDSGYTSMLFDELKNSGNLKKPVLITFDDGYDDNYYNAYPILKSFNFKATIFLVTDLIDKPHYLSTSQIKEMSDTISFQSHTLTHPEMDKQGYIELERELSGSKRIIEDIVEKPVNVIAYPYGRYNGTVVGMASRYYTYGVTTKYRKYNIYGDLEIERLCITRSCHLSEFVRRIF